MWLNIISTTIYQQCVLTFILYYVAWQPNQNPVKDNQATFNDEQYTFVFQTFYMMQFFNMINCSISYETNQ